MEGTIPLTWEKYAGNPVIAAPPEGPDVQGLRDHRVWKEGDTWYQLIGSGVKGVGGVALLYQSQDLFQWHYVHPLCVGDRDRTGEMWECPDFFPLDDKHCLLVSVHPEFLYTYYFTGTYADHKFTPEAQGITDLGGYFYAAQTLLDDRGRRIMLAGWASWASKYVARRMAKNRRSSSTTARLDAWLLIGSDRA